MADVINKETVEDKINEMVDERAVADSWTDRPEYNEDGEPNE